MTIYDEKLKEILSNYEKQLDLYKFELGSSPEGRLIVQNNNGNKQYYDIHIGKMTYSFKDFE